MHSQNPVDAFLFTFAYVVYGLTFFQASAVHADKTECAHFPVKLYLEHQAKRVLLLVYFNGNRFVLLQMAALNKGRFPWRGKIVDDSVKERLNSDIFQGGAYENRNNIFPYGSPADGLFNHLRRNLFSIKIELGYLV